ncbi:kappaPI-actitoxin-Avd3a-like [Haemaphysalis longicornis]
MAVLRGAVFLSFVVVAFCSLNCQQPAPQPCKYPDACKCPKTVEPCVNRVPRFYFNTTTNTCDPFEWSGCRPNCNNFATLEECKRFCGSLAG